MSFLEDLTSLFSSKRQNAFAGNRNSNYSSLSISNYVDLSFQELTGRARNPYTRKIVSRLPYDALRSGFEVILDDENERLHETISNFIDNFRLLEKLKEAWLSARIYGSSYLFIGTGEDHTEPLDTSTIRNISFIELFDREDVRPFRVGREIGPYYRVPEFYEIRSDFASDFIRVHASRVIRFDGIILPYKDFRSRNYNHLSVIEFLCKELDNFNESQNKLSYILSHFNQTVYKIENLAGMSGSKNKDLINKRFQLMEECRSIFNSIIIDKNSEDFVHTNMNLSGVTDIVARQQELLAGASNIPTTILFGVGPRSGLSSGEGLSEKRDWFDVVQEERDIFLKPKLEFFIDLFIRASGIRRDNLPGYRIEFGDLYQKSEQDQADLQAKQAETDSKYINAGVLSEDEVAISRFGSDTFTLSTKLDPTLRGENGSARE